MSAATPVTCASTSVSTNQGSSPVCAPKDTSCKAPDYARVSTPASFSSWSEHLPLCAFTHKRCTESTLNHSLTAALFLSCSIQHHEMCFFFLSCRYKWMWNRRASVYWHTDMCEYPWTIPVCGHKPVPRPLCTSVWEVSDTSWKLVCVHTQTHLFPITEICAGHQVKI